jgi:hypothetical protein
MLNTEQGCDLSLLNLNLFIDRIFKEKFKIENHD